MLNNIFKYKILCYKGDRIDHYSRMITSVKYKGN